MSVPFTHAFDWARRHVESGALPTAVLGVATASGIQALDAFGTTGTRPARTDDHYRLFSITKPLVGLAAARMIEAGLVTTETPLQADVPEFGRDRDDVVRLRHLVSHTSGIAEPPMDSPDGLEAGLLGPRDFAAGSASRYSTIAFEGIARMIRARTGRTWDAAVADAVGPVGATGLTLDEAADPHDVPDAAAEGLDLQRFAALRHRAPVSWAGQRTCWRSVPLCCATPATSRARRRSR
nr:serine hydrolase domain-containing protein [Diaminobutyricimonas aerilata]